MASKPRKDVVKNDRRILRAAGDLIRIDPDNLTIAAVAERAGLSVPTVYRYYSSAEVLRGRYMAEVDQQIRDYSHECDTAGTALFDDVLSEWGRIIEVYGPGLVQLRSRSGFLARLNGGDPTMQMLREAWERPIRRVLRANDIDGSYFEGALFLLNMMFDPRELLDLTARGNSMEQTIGIMKTAYLGAIRAWRDQDTPTV
ncbi:TetR/AcrR family transcriptional regulator [Mycetocola reblochoni]|uniref:TetR/AcrR family transcriptional regulator n=1 Tax=Mycetocola reblochoni TaxID=331618 RepID=A0A3L6ZLA4_9MICO|nr:TetR/AcrR family transcriptional regulator [Mycetocola reblochoni]RLP68435.1 TetR/AcrR family transcriptional regulator [Mycetocola reblochoni]